jgi:HlyD family secretion protein
MVRYRWQVFALGVLVLAAAGLWISSRGRADRVAVDTGTVARQARFQSTVSASGEVVATRYADIGSSAMGKIVRLAVAEGDRVRAGQLLARIDPVQAESDAASVRAQLGALEAEQRAATEQVRTTGAEVEAAEARAREAAQQYERQQELLRQGIIAAAELETARAAADTTRAQVTAAKAAVARARQAAEASERRVAQARAQVARASDVVAKTSIVAPIDGIVSRLRVREGEMVVVGIQNQPGTTLMTISDLSAVNAEVKAAEADVLRLALGQPATVTLEALPGKRFPGRVVEIGASALPVAGTGAAAREFKVVVRLDQPDPGLRPGLTCDAEIITSERQNVLTVPLQSVVLRGDPAQSGQRSGVFVVENGRAAFRQVTSGVIGGLDIEVAGIDEGTSIVVGPYQVLRELNDGAPVRVNARQDAR